MLTACYSQNSGSPQNPDWYGLSMHVAPDSVTPTSLQFTMQNSNETQSFTHGTMFSIEKYDGGQWQQVPYVIDDVFWAWPLFFVEPNSSVDESINWEHMHGQLSPGQYRVVRQFSKGDTTSNIYATFTIDGDRQPPSWEGLNLYVSSGSVTPTGLQLTMINTNDEQYFGHGVMFTIEEYRRGGWRPVRFTNDVAWILPLMIIAPGMTIDDNINWHHMHGTLPPGQYRIMRQFSTETSPGPTPPAPREMQYLYATFTIDENWQTTHDRWQADQTAKADVAFARFAGLDLVIHEHSPSGLSFSLTNNDNYYSYIINSIFVGWEDRIDSIGVASAVEYAIFSSWGWSDGDSWPFGDEKTLHPGEYFHLDVNWYDSIGSLRPSMHRLSDNPYVFQITIDIALDVDEEYISTNFRRRTPDVPGQHHRISANFDIVTGM